MKKQTISFFIGLIGMILLVVGTFLTPGELLQKILFFSGTFLMTITAFTDRHKMYSTLEVVIIIGTVLAFFSGIGTELRYWIMGVPAVLAVIYLIKVKYFQKDTWGILASIALLCVALGFATDPGDLPILFHGLLAAGAVMLTIYSLIQFFYYKVRIALLFMILNAVFSINPLIELWKLVF